VVTLIINLREVPVCISHLAGSLKKGTLPLRIARYAVGGGDPQSTSNPVLRIIHNYLEIFATREIKARYELPYVEASG
jgi:hypothetical protein